MVKRVSFILFAVIFLFSLGLISSANCGGATVCNCGDTIIENYVMNNNLVCPSVAYYITNDSISLDCDSYSLNGSGNNVGISVTGDNVEIRNCNLQNFQRSISSSQTYGLFIHDNYIRNNYLAFELVSGTGTNVTRNYVLDNAQGITLVVEDGATIYNNWFDNITGEKTLRNGT